ncbi:MAG TPA: dihydrodipicolinate synthase family protein [Conexibacter sp.]|jgi:dihydrodipicolinate synthase/N-acetylneuraminate lyase
MIPYIDTDEFDRHYAALVLPFKPDSLEPDLDAFRGLVRYFTQDEQFLAVRGGLIVNPEAGEIFYMTPEERAETIRIVLEERPAAMPVFSGAYGLSRPDVLASAVECKTLGVDGIFVMPPTGTMEVTTTMDGAKNPEIWQSHVEAIADATELPLIIHPTHPTTAQWGRALPIQSVKAVVETIPSVVGWKMIYGVERAHFQVASYLRTLPRHVGILNTPGFGVHDALLRGLVDGAVQGSYNFMKEAQVSHRLAWDRGDIEEARRIFVDQIVPIRGAVYADHSRLHLRYKLATWIRGNVSHPFMRPPMPRPRREEAELLYDVFERSGLSVISRDELERVLAQGDEILGYTPALTGAPQA